ncbi:glycosyltransferase family 4 protein [Pseudosulfitobacter pseudonitzschiae]|uniref:glycosyltransferase family 4 protein n=1 Tax=Pseudosulfitobacter pseudonitzschiae TaxID=1402135 RepID=UPI001AF5FF48|nr:glycosyltransferase family 1 protein [Pseudosulfitobacter pseudonitzschiae]MBM1817427.1 glycosyltransferase family 4 protein [Pseudosulfitobacter pseudonitzschiae]MBM1834625.1 glycosyltransferase family 4 protein [Pseudosulfitobacter pseudonitzschiae]MBM1839489.1 glycosyltransferase family 4 protein [Pseudosulfitobacter pseudonitzschiae]MBM1844340.1 glycosyltransferase family 4 protein [Pseudosulfitobacter pseudonitzschiae]MBM1849174.1 glycosyltransferase family 4 protein [Pseudosulfitobact
MYYFDMTDILLYVEKETTVSGIQRVSFEVIRRMVKQLGAENVRLSYWDRLRREYIAIDASFLADMEEFSPDILGAVFFGKRARAQNDAAPTLMRYRNRPLKYWFYSKVRSYHAARGHERYFAKMGSSIAEWSAFKTRKAPTRLEATEDIRREKVSEVIRPGDQLIILGAIWNIDGLEPALQRLKDAKGIKIYQLVHDLIPIIATKHIAADFSGEFYHWLLSSIGYCDRFIANSQNTARDLQRFMDEVGEQRPIDVVPLAQKFDVVHSNQVKDPKKPFKSRLKSLEGVDHSVLNLTKSPFVLVVGTMESRKNLWRLAQAWQRLTHTPGLDVPKLVFAGKPGWYNDDFETLMKATGNLGGWVQFSKRPSDTELGFLYESCLFTATVSVYEGWGLPIGESLSFGKTAVVADNSSMPEVGGDLVEYCDAHSISSIYDACHKLIANPDHRRALEKRISQASLRTWDDVTTELLEAVGQE